MKPIIPPVDVEPGGGIRTGASGKEAGASRRESGKEATTPPLLFHHWWALALRGTLATLFGLIALFWTRLPLEILVICFGAFALVGGLLLIVAALGDRGSHRVWGVLLLESLVGIVVGLLTFFWPLVTALILLHLIAFWAMATGLLEGAAALEIHHVFGHGWMVLSGGMASFLVGVVLALLPGGSLLSLTWLFGIYAVLFGVLLLVLAFQWRRWNDDSRHARKRPSNKSRQDSNFFFIVHDSLSDFFRCLLIKTHTGIPRDGLHQSVRRASKLRGRVRYLR